MWRAFISSFVFEHDSISSLIRELKRNSNLRMACGFTCKYQNINGQHKLNAVLSKVAFSRFIKSLMQESSLIEEIFKDLREEISELIADYGQTVVIDGKLIHSYAKRKNKNTVLDGRRDVDADYRVKEYTSTTKLSMNYQ